MCNVKEYSRIFKEIEKLTPEDTAQIILETDDGEERRFYEVVGDYLLQKKQKEAIERKLF